MDAKQFHLLLKFGIPIDYRKRKLSTLLHPGSSHLYLETEIEKTMLEAFRNPGRTIWVNLFAPAELIHALGLNSLSMEGMAALISGRGMEGDFIGKAEEMGIARTLCSYHRTIIGMAALGLFPKPAMVLSTSALCDANVKTFGLVADIMGVPFELLDIPYEEDAESLDYLSSQLKRLAEKLGGIAGKGLSTEGLSRVIRKANATRSHMLEAYRLRKDKYIEASRKGNFNQLYAVQGFMGSEVSLRFYEKLCRELRESPFHLDGETRLLWLHLAPHYNSEVFDVIYESGARVVYEEFNQVHWEELDPEKPYEAIARKLISNHGNGGIFRRMELALGIARYMEVDGVIHFSQWGCRQSSGAIGIMKRKFEDEGFHFISLDGDCVDSENYSSGQFRTRLEGFLEMVGSQKVLHREDRGARKV